MRLRALTATVPPALTVLVVVASSPVPPLGGPAASAAELPAARISGVRATADDVAGGDASAGGAGTEEQVRVRLRRAVRDLDVRRETRSGYDRDLFEHWVDANDDCQDTRDEVLDAESLVDVSGCDIRTGEWRSVYDGEVVRDSSELDVDHMVPLAEAWDSGAGRWTATTRTRFANDLGDGRTLAAVTAAANRSKSDQDPAEWLPSRRVCGYVRGWVAAKTRWSLAVDRPERRALLSLADGCGNAVLEVQRARVRTARSGSTPSGDTDPRFGSCSDAVPAGYGPYREGEDEEYSWYTDGDDDGVVCES